MQQPFRMPQRPTGSLTDVDPRRSPRPTEGLGPGRRPRPTHIWDPERGVIPLDPNAPSRFVPPPPPGVAEAYMRGIARRQGVAKEIPPRTQIPMTFTPDFLPNERGRSTQEEWQRQHPKLYLYHGIDEGAPIPPAMSEGVQLTGPTEMGGSNPQALMGMSAPPGAFRSPGMVPQGDMELRPFWPSVSPRSIPRYDPTETWQRGNWEGLRGSGEFIVPPRQRY
jgi:hypothetical protein